MNYEDYAKQIKKPYKRPIPPELRAKIEADTDPTCDSESLKVAVMDFVARATKANEAWKSN